MYTAALLLFASMTTAQIVRSEPLQISATMQAMHNQIDAWLNELAQQTAFAEWPTAERTVTALGPGTHSWLVTLAQGQETVGYLVVQATPNGAFRLGEYGLGSEPLYSASVLQRSLASLGLDDAKDTLQIEQRYASPLLAAWRIVKEGESPLYLDAKTGEQLPIQDTIWLKAVADSVLEASSIVGASEPTPFLLLPTFDVYERMPWLTGAPLSISFRELAIKLSQQDHIWYSSEPYGGAHRFVWAVIGYHGWSDGLPYMAIDHEGTRYIPFDILAANGHYYD